mgnify:CR=1 FL=1
MARLATGGVDDDMRQFNYYGAVGGGAPNIEEFTEADILKLEREVEDLLRNRITSAAELQHNNHKNNNEGIININSQ